MKFVILNALFLITLAGFRGTAVGSDDYSGCPLHLGEWQQYRTLRLNDLLKRFEAKEAEIALNKYYYCLSNPQLKDEVKKTVNACMGKNVSYAKGIIKLNPVSKNQPVLIPDDPSIDVLPGIFLDESLRLGILDVNSKSMASFAKKVKTEFPKNDFIVHLDEFINAHTVIIRLIGEAYDRYYHITEKKYELLAIIIEKKGREGQELKPARIYFRRYQLPKEKGDTLKIPEQTEIHCYQCHASGPIGVLNTRHKSLKVHNVSHDIPLEKQSHHAKVFNSSLEKSAYVTLKGFEKVYRDLGPGIGPSVNKDRTEEFVSQCAGKFLGKDSEGFHESVKTIKNAMDCSSCHDSKNMAALNIRSQRFDRLIHESITAGHMPAYSILSDKEKQALYACLMKEYFAGTGRDNLLVEPKNLQGVMAKYLFDVPCSKGSIKKPANVKGRDRSRFKRWDK